MKYLLILILLLLLATREFFYFNERHIYKENEVFKKSYSINHEPKKNSVSQYFFVDDILVTTAPFPTYHYGDTISIRGKVSKKITKKGEILVVENPDITKVEKVNIVLSLSKFVREKVGDSALKILPEKEAGLLLGIILGVRDKIDNDFYQMLKNAGVLHVIAASGQNVSIAAGLLLVVFGRFVKRKLSLLFTSVGVLIYASLTGFDPPIVRASIMAIFAFAGLFYGRQTNSLYALFLTAWGMLFLQPEEISDISFQLSFLSTFGILTVKPLLDRVVLWRFISVLKDDITTTLSAQIATFPVMLSAFGAYSLLSFPINILVLWTIPIIMIFGGIGGVLSVVSPLLSLPFFLICFPFLAYFTNVIVFFSSFNWQIGVFSMPISVLGGYYLILLAIVIRFGIGKPQKK